VCDTVHVSSNRLPSSFVRRLPGHQRVTGSWQLYNEECARTVRRGMADGTSAVMTLTCQSCDMTTTQAPGTRRRTVCPHCGNFYHRQDASSSTTQQRQQPSRSNVAHSSTRAHHQPNLERYARRPPSDRLPNLDSRKVAVLSVMPPTYDRGHKAICDPSPLPVCLYSVGPIRLMAML